MTSSERTAARLAYVAHGRPSAPTIVFLHSLGLDHRSFEPVLQALAQSYHLLAIDLPGHGGSPSGAEPCTLSSLVADVLSVVDAERISRFHCCGVSLGGLLGLALALAAPERLQSLAACNTAARVGSDASWRERIEAVRARGMTALAESLPARWVAPHFARERPDVVRALQATVRATDPAGYIACCEVLARTDLSAQVQRIEVPTLVIGGELDLATPPELARSLHAAIRGSELTLFANSAHLSNVDCASAFSERLARLVARCRA